MSPATSYGTTDQAPAQNGAVHTSDEENPLLPKDSNGFGKRLHKHFTTSISKNWADLILLGGYVITGLLDSSAVFIWGSFVSMQTGNTVYLGLGLIDPQGSDRWLKSLVSIGSFCIGSFFFSRFHRHLGARRRWVLTLSYLLQTMLILAAAVMVTLGTTAEPGLDGHVVVPLGLLAFQSSGQAVTSRVLQYNGLTSVVLTSNYCDLFSDANLFRPSIKADPERNRRVAAPLLLLAGACFGGLWSRSSFGLAGALWTAAALKFLVVGTWLVWAEEEEGEDE